MKRIAFNIISLLTITFFIGCTAPAGDELKPSNTTTKLILDALFDEGENFRVVLYKVRAGQEIVVDNAVVELYSEEDELLETLQFQNENNRTPYYSSIHTIAEVDKTYKIRAEASGFARKEWVGKIPNPSYVSSSQRDDIGGDVSTTNETIFISTKIEDTELDQENYFIVNFLHIPDTKFLGDKSIFPGEPMKVEKFSQLDPGIVFFDNRRVLLTDRSFSGGSKDLIYKVKFEPGVLEQLRDEPSFGQVITELHTIEKDYYDNLVSSTNQTNTNSPFTPNGGAGTLDTATGFGIFSGTSTRRDTVSINL